MDKPHDRGGWPDSTPINQSEHVLADWERRVDAMHNVLGEKGLRRTDEMRRAIESLEPQLYESLSYYERWTEALLILTLEKGLFTWDELTSKLSDVERALEA